MVIFNRYVKLPEGNHHPGSPFGKHHPTGPGMSQRVHLRNRRGLAESSCCARHRKPARCYKKRVLPSVVTYKQVKLWPFTSYKPVLAPFMECIAIYIHLYSKLKGLNVDRICVPHEADKVAAKERSSSTKGPSRWRKSPDFALLGRRYSNGVKFPKAMLDKSSWGKRWKI